MMHRHSQVKFAGLVERIRLLNASVAGIALLISALVQAKTLSLYHMHILYDAISLVV
jgi:hypothetical protein